MIITTPKALAAELGISPKKVRWFLRKNYRRPSYDKYTRWYVTPNMARALRSYFKRNKRNTV